MSSLFIFIHVKLKFNNLKNFLEKLYETVSFSNSGYWCQQPAISTSNMKLQIQTNNIFITYQLGTYVYQNNIQSVWKMLTYRIQWTR